MDAREHPRPPWRALPAALREDVEAVLGSGVVGAESRAGGWSPGSADRVLLADGRRAFVKAADEDLNAKTVALHRREVQVLALLAGSGTAPALMGTAAAGSWFALIEEDVDGHQPDPASRTEVSAVLDAVAALPVAGAAATRTLSRLQEDLAAEAAGWRRLIEDDALGTVPVGREAAEALDALAREQAEVLSGDRLVHGDLRFDNALIDGGGRARLVDWPGAAVGAGWFDALTVVLDVRRLAGPAAADRHLAHPALVDVPAHHLDVLLAVLGAYFLDSARKPPSPGVEAVRGFQRLQGGVVLDWLRERRVIGSAG